MKKQDWIKVVLIGIFGFVVSPFIFLAVQGLIGLVIAAAVGMTAIALAPVVSMKLANLRLRGIKQEATQNPIETMQVVYAQRTAALSDFATGLEQFSARIANFESQLRLFERKYPDRAKQFTEQVDRMKALKQARWNQYQQARSDLARFHDTIEEADAVWKMTQAANALNKSAGLQMDPLEQIKQKTALESVETSMNASFAQLERLMAESREESMVIDITPKPMIEVQR